MSESRLRVLTRLVRVAAVLLAAVLLFSPLPGAVAGGWRGTLLDFGHVPLFAALVFVWSVPDRSPWRYALLAAALAGLVEVVQYFVGRSADWGDLFRGVLGAFAAAAGLTAWRSRRRPVRAVAFVLLAVGLLTWPVIDSGPRLFDAYEGYRDFPVLAKFETQRELLRWGSRQAELTRTPDPANPGRWVGRLDFHPGPGKYPGARMEPVTREFRGYRWLCCAFEVEGGPLPVMISVRGGPLVDGHTVHFQAGRVYGPGPQLVRLDLPAQAATADPVPLDLADVRQVLFFVLQPKEVRTILIRRVWLEK